jgi:hypothetical protein
VSKQSGDELKKVYALPQLQVYGDLRQITQNINVNDSSRIDNGGKDPNHRTA